MPLTVISNAVNGEPLFLIPVTIDASAAIH